MRRGQTLAAHATGADRLIGLAILVSTGSLVAGWTLPLMTVKRLVFLSDQVSLMTAVRDLWQADQIFLVTVVVVFSILFPTLKLAVAIHIWYVADAESGALRRLLAWLSELAKWSMLDVFVVALTVVAIQVSLVGNVLVKPGLYFFVAAILLSMVVVRRVAAAAARFSD